MQRKQNRERQTENGLIEHVMDVISIVMQLWWLHRPQQRITFSSSSDGWMERWWWMERTFFMLPCNPCSPRPLFKEGWRDSGWETKRSALQEGLNPSSRRNRIKGNGVMEDTAAGGGGGEELGCTTSSVRTGGAQCSWGACAFVRLELV